MTQQMLTCKAIGPASSQTTRTAELMQLTLFVVPCAEPRSLLQALCSRIKYVFSLCCSCCLLDSSTATSVDNSASAAERCCSAAAAGDKSHTVGASTPSRAA